MNNSVKQITKKKIIFIGAGNLATCLSLAWQKKGISIYQVFSRTEKSARELATKLNCSWTTNILEIKDDADLYVFSVKDSVLKDLLETMPPNNGIWVHTAGSMSISVFPDSHSSCGVFYPLQTFSKDRPVDFTDIPIFLEARNADVYALLEDIAKQLSNNVIRASSLQRQYLHIAAVFACNFTNHMYAIAENILSAHKLDFKSLIPLIQETAQKTISLHPIDAQTGPAVRYDENVINKHLDFLSDTPTLQTLYKELSNSIHKYAVNTHLQENEPNKL
ncbi:MAG: DUF2520 domain-containing protein [Bacteroidaceae bacterium]|nr:DUF2520 domain-containing protein [Bacteroidaceae bacterium]